MFYLLLFFVSVNSLKLCIDCKYFKKHFFEPNTFAKCSFSPIEPINDEYLVDGSKNIKVEYYYCSTSRKYICGKEGKYFVPKS